MTMFCSSGCGFDGQQREEEMRKLIIAALGAALLSGNATADMTLKDYKSFTAHLRDNNDPALSLSIDSYIMGAISGMAATNAQNVYEKKGMIYCLPPKLPLNPNNVKALLADKKSAALKVMPDDTALGTAIMFVLLEAFPC